MRPNEDVPKVVLGLLKCAWLKTLKNSARNSACRFSSMRKLLNAEKSQLFRPGPRTCPMPPLPNLNGAGSAKQLVSNHCVTCFGVATDGQVMSARFAVRLLFSRTVATLIA